MRAWLRSTKACPRPASLWLSDMLDVLNLSYYIVVLLYYASLRYTPLGLAISAGACCELAARRACDEDDSASSRSVASSSSDGMLVADATS